MSLSIIIIEKGGSLKTLTVKEYNESELYNILFLFLQK